VATVENKSSLENILNAVLSIAGQEKTMFYSPRIYSDQRNVVESLLLSSLVKSYPLNQNVIDQIAPFVKVETISNTDGYIQLPDNYRNLLGSPMIFANPESTGECGAQTEPLTAHNFKVGMLKAGCRLNAVVIVPESEFADRTKSTYDTPSYENPIGMYIDNKRIKICPYDVSRVAVMYAKKERLVRYGYIMQPDDTYLFDENTTEETEFTSNSYEMIFNAMMALYSAYAKNQELQNWSMVLSQKGIF